jgi:23S rRNA pseudouridine2457 synthase
MMSDLTYFAIFKPYDMLSQFTGEANDSLLGDLYDFPKDVYPIGRLDKDSEGLLLLTNDNGFKTQLLDPLSKVAKTYLVQVDGDITADAIQLLSLGKITIKHNGKEHRVLPAQCKKIAPPENLPERSVPVRFRKNIPTSWIKLTITEGKNRQIRKMTAAAGFPTLRLIRIGIGKFRINEFENGMVTSVRKEDVLY